MREGEYGVRGDEKGRRTCERDLCANELEWEWVSKSVTGYV